MSQANLSERRWSTDLSPQAQREVLRYGEAAAPQEACGIILPPDRVVRLPNRVKPARLKTEAYEVHLEDVVAAVERWMETEPSAVHHLRDFDFVVWHTHPGGGVGPSRRDVRAKRQLYPDDSARVRFLVVTLPWGESSFF